MRNSISYSYKYDEFCYSCNDFAVYSRKLSNAKRSGWNLAKYKIWGFWGHNTGDTGAISYSWQSVKYKILSFLCYYAGHNTKPKRASKFKAGWKALELEAAKIIEKEFLRTTDGKCPLMDISINNRTVKLTVGGGALYSPITMLQSEFFTKNCLSTVSFKFTEGGSEVSIERTSNRSFNYVVTKGSVVISRQKSTRGRGGACTTVTADADGAVRVTDIERVRERYQRHKLSGVDILIRGTSLLDMLCAGNWKWDPEDGTYVKYVPKNKAPRTTLSVSNCKSIERREREYGDMQLLLGHGASYKGRR